MGDALCASVTETLLHDCGPLGHRLPIRYVTKGLETAYTEGGRGASQPLSAAADPGRRTSPNQESFCITKGVGFEC